MTVRRRRHRTEALAAEETARIEREGQVVGDAVVLVKQTVPNACGTVGILHSVCNNVELLGLRDGYLGCVGARRPRPLLRRISASARTRARAREFARATVGMTPAERGAYLERDDTIEAAHAAAGEEGQTDAATADMDTNLHFVCLVHVDSGLYELDGRKVRRCAATFPSLSSAALSQLRACRASRSPSGTATRPRTRCSTTPRRSCASSWPARQASSTST